MAKTLKTSAELATSGYESEDQPPKEFKPRLVEINLPEPSLDSIMKLSSVGIKDHEAGRQHLITQAKANLQKLETACPSIFAKITADLRKADEIRALAADAIEPAINAVNDVESKLKIRGDLRLRIHRAEHALVEATKKAHDPATLELPVLEQFEIKNSVALLPRKIADMTKEADELKAQILAVSKPGGIAIERIIKRMGVESGKQPNSPYITDGHLHQLADGGFLDLK